MTYTRVRLASPVRCCICKTEIKEGQAARAVLTPDGYIHKCVPSCEMKRAAEHHKVMAEIERQK
jgi:hypothetical protein